MTTTLWVLCREVGRSPWLDNLFRSDLNNGQVDVALERRLTAMGTEHALSLGDRSCRCAPEEDEARQLVER
jgi:hypothetical protein